MPSKLILAHTFAYISLDAIITQEADKTHIEYGFPVLKQNIFGNKSTFSLRRYPRYILPHERKPRLDVLTIGYLVDP